MDTIWALRIGCICFALLLCVGAASVTKGYASDTESRTYVKPIDKSIFEEGLRSLTNRDRKLVDLYMKGAQRYVLTPEDGVFPNAGTEHWRNITERAHGAAVLGSLPSNWPLDLRERCLSESTSFVNDFVAQFKVKNDFGNPWQCSWWVGEMGIAVWFLWDRLSPDVQNAAAEMIIFHADRITVKEPGARVEKDTEAETVSWNSTVLSLAVNMMPNHPNNPKWQKAAKRYAYTVFGTSADLLDNTPGDDGIAIKDWVVGANVHDDYSLENHNRFHIEYMFAAYRFIIQGAAMYRVGCNAIPKAFSHHFTEVHENVLLKCMNSEKFAVFVSDNDWKRYHVWTESAAVHGYVAMASSSPLASALEEEALVNASSYWNEFPEGFQYDNPYVCGKAWCPRIADIVLLHLLSPPSPKPLPEKAVEKELQGARVKKCANLLTQYSKNGSFRSFFWGPGPIVRHVEPKANGWMFLPLETNYRITLDGKAKSNIADVTNSDIGRDWFWVLRSYPHGEAEVFLSLPDETVVYMASISGKAVSGAKTIDSFVNVEKPYDTLVVHFQCGKATYTYGDKQWDRTDEIEGLEFSSQWVNLADSMGYVVLNLSQSQPKMLLPVAGKRSQLGLYHLENPGEIAQQFVTVILPNQNHRQTKAITRKLSANFSNGLMTCLTPRYFVWANFSNSPASVELAKGVSQREAMTALPNTAGIAPIAK